MADIEFTYHIKSRTVQAEGHSQAGIEFIDSWIPTQGELQVVDSGRIIVPQSSIGGLAAAARRRGLTYAINKPTDRISNR